MRNRSLTVVALIVSAAFIFVTAATAGDVKLPKMNRKTLDNGLEIIALEHHEQPVVSIRLVIRGGQSFDTADKAGLANFTASLLRQGTTTRDANQISEEIDFVGGSLGAGAGLDQTNANCEVLSKHLAVGLDLLSDVVINPTFADEEVERIRNQTISAIMRSKDDPGTVAAQMFNKEVFGDHPYALPAAGTEESISMLTRDDVVAFHEQYYIPNNSFLIVVGDIKPDEVFEMAAAKFGVWKMGTVPEMSFPAPPKIEGYRIVLIDKKDATQSNIIFGHLGVNRSSPDIFPVRVMNYIVGGGGFVSRLMKDIRAEQGLTYDINSQYSYQRDIGDFAVTTFTGNENTVGAIKSTIDLLKQVRAEGLTEEEVADCHSFFSGYFPLVFETPAQITRQLQTAELYGLGVDYLTSYVSKIEGVDVAAANQAATDHIDPDNMIFVVVGKADDIKAGLEELGPVTMYRLSEL